MTARLIKDNYSMSVNTDNNMMGFMEYKFGTKESEFIVVLDLDTDIYALEEFVEHIFSKLPLDYDLNPDKILIKFLKLRQDERSL